VIAKLDILLMAQNVKKFVVMEYSLVINVMMEILLMVMVALLHAK